MNTFANNLIKYQKLGSLPPPNLSDFKCITRSFLITLKDDFLPIYALNHVSCQIISLMAYPPYEHPNKQLQLNISGELKFSFDYTTSSLTHSVTSLIYTFPLLDSLSCTDNSLSKSTLSAKLYIEDLFAYTLDPTHIYIHVLLLAVKNKLGILLK